MNTYISDFYIENGKLKIELCPKGKYSEKSLYDFINRNEIIINELEICNPFNLPFFLPKEDYNFVY